MRRVKVGRFLLTVAACLTLLTQTVSAAISPMLFEYTPSWEYGKEGQNGFAGYIPALDKRVTDNPWQLNQWTGLFTFPNGQTRIVSNYDVFGVKKSPSDADFSKENGFGLVHKSQAALGDLFDSVWSGQTIPDKQRQYFKGSFASNADDPIFKNGHEYYYQVNRYYEFLRTAGIVQRMGMKFDRTQKVNENTYRALYDVSPWPEMKVTNGSTLSINYTGYGFSQRDIRLIAAPKGAFPELTNVVSLTDGKYINTSNEKATGTVTVNAKPIADILGKEVDIIMDDGYGRTVIESITLPIDQPMDFVPVKLNLTEGGQLWVQIRYDGDDVISSDYIKPAGIPNTVSVKMGGAMTAEYTMGSRHTSFPQTLKKGTVLNAYLGNISPGTKPGKYYFKATATVNNPNHQDRAVEFPAAAYRNNEIKGEWMIEVKGPENDLIAESITITPTSLKSGQKGTINAKVKNVGSQSVPDVRIRFYADAKQIYETKRTLPANQTVNVGGFTWSGAIGTHNISVHVDPFDESPDKDRSNNRASTGCNITAAESAEQSVTGCTNPNASSSWDVTYWIITGYPTKSYTSSYTDANGNTQTYTNYYTDYSDPIWAPRTVIYSESLNVSLEVDTKQGIPTDKKNPKESDRESRGSWEIIPWAAKQGLKPNEVTRAGYGIEVKATTKYTTDWEKKVPSGLEGIPTRFGGAYTGPTEVWAFFWDTKGDYVTKKQLVKTSGDNMTATWELPEERFRFSTGEEIWERKHYTAKETPDGKYRVKIMAKFAGRNQLVACADKIVTIYGSMYDDWQIRRDTGR